MGMHAVRASAHGPSAEGPRCARPVRRVPPAGVGLPPPSGAARARPRPPPGHAPAAPAPARRTARQRRPGCAGAPGGGRRSRRGGRGGVGAGGSVQPEPGRQEVIHRDEPPPGLVRDRTRQVSRLTAVADRGPAHAARGGSLPLGQHRTLHPPILPAPARAGCRACRSGRVARVRHPAVAELVLRRCPAVGARRKR